MTEAVELIDGGLPLSARQEQFSVAFVHMIASAAGCSIKRHDTDYEGVDLTVTSAAAYERFAGPQFELQLKCTTQQNRLTPTHMTWSLATDRFKKLTAERMVPAYLGVLLIPDDPDLLLDHNESRLLTESCMYWEAGSKLGTMPEGQKSATVRLPRSNIFTVETLLGIMKTIGDGGDW